MGDGVWVTLMGSKNSLGGRSKHLGYSRPVLAARVMRVVQGLGFPGSSSHLKGTEAEVCSGGVSMPERSGDSTVSAMEKRGSFSVEFDSGSMVAFLRGLGRC